LDIAWVASTDVSLTAAESAVVIGDLRKARRRQRVAAIHWVDALYQVYVTALVAVVALVFLSGFVGDGKVSGSSLDQVRDHGPAVLGLLAAVALFVGLRSGSRGGPLALERADVRHVLLAPVDRAVALRGPALRQVRFLVAVGAGVGAATGQLALRRLPGNPAEWLMVGAAFGAVTVALGFGAALTASGIRLPRWIATAFGLGLVVWSVGDVAGKLPMAPTTVIGALAVWPLDTDPLGLVGPVLALVLVGVGVARVAATSLEAAERRTALVGQLRFAVTLQDLRTVMVLRRQLAQERPRAKPWIRGSRRQARWPILRRGVRSVCRWPATRLVRVIGLAVVAGFALRGVWAGTTPLVVAAGLALWVAALDAVEPLGQEVDHPGRTDGFPVERGHLFLGHLPVVYGVSAVAGLVAGVVAALPFGDRVEFAPAVVSGLAVGLLAGCGAVVSTIQGAPSAVDVLSMSTPEIAGARTVMRTAWPPGMAVAGTAPLLLARAALGRGDDLVPALALGGMPLVVVAVLVAGWVRFHDPIHEWIRTAMEEASPTKALERAAAEREAAERESVGVDSGGAEPSDGSRGGEGDDGAVDNGGADRGSGKRSGSTPPAGTRRKPSQSVGPAPVGVQGGTSSKPIGRARDREPAASPNPSATAGSVGGLPVDPVDPVDPGSGSSGGTAASSSPELPSDPTSQIRE